MKNEVVINKKGVGKTLKKWASLGFVPKRGRKGELRYGNRGDIAKGKAPQLYFDPSDVKEDKKAAMDLYNKLEQPLVNHNLRGFTMDQLIKIGKRPQRGYEGHKRKRFAGAQDHPVNYDWFWDPEEIENGDIFATRSGRELYKLHQNRTYNRSGKTLNQWLKIGYIPKKGCDGHERYRSEALMSYDGINSTAIYYDEDEVRFDKEAAVRLAREMNRLQRAEREAERREKEERQRIAEEFRESRCTRYQWARVGRVANKGAKFEWGSRLNQAIKDEDVYQFGNNYMYCHLDDTHEANADEMSVWEEFFEFEKRGVGFTAIRSRLIDLCPEYQPFRKSLLASWEREQFDTWWE